MDPSGWWQRDMPSKLRPPEALIPASGAAEPPRRDMHACSRGAVAVRAVALATHVPLAARVALLRRRAAGHGPRVRLLPACATSLEVLAVELPGVEMASGHVSRVGPVPARAAPL